MKIILIGMMGSGKSTIGKVIAKKLDLNLVDTDGLIEERSGIKIKDIFERFGEEHFRKLEREVFLSLSEDENIVISTGGGAVLNDTLDPFKGENIIYLKWSVDGLVKNLESKTSNRPLLSEGELREKLTNILSQRVNLYEGWANKIIECDGKSVNQVVGILLDLIK